MRLLTVLTCVLVLAAPIPAQNSPGSSNKAEVTFYSLPVSLLGGLSKSDPGAFKGRLFDGDHQLAFMEPARFITFAMDPGAHIFSAASWITEQPNPGAHVTMNLVPGHHYFVETGHWAGGYLFLIRDIPCVVAQHHNTHSKPLEADHLRPDGIPIAVYETSFPACS